MVLIFPNICLWRRSLRSKLGGIDPEKLYRATLRKPSKQAKRPECLLSDVSRHSIYPRYVRPTDKARQTNLQ